MGRPLHYDALANPNAYTLALQRKMCSLCCSPTVNVDRLKPFFERSDEPPPPGPASDAGQAGEHEVDLLLNRLVVRGVTEYLVRWRGHASPAYAWRRVEELDNYRNLVAEHDAIAPNRRAARSAARRAVLRGPGPGHESGSWTRARSFISGPSGGWCAQAARCRAGTSGGLAGGWVPGRSSGCPSRARASAGGPAGAVLLA